MTGINPLGVNVLITTDEVIFHAPVDTGADARTLLQSIIIAELRFIKPLLGSTAYNALITAKNKVVTADNKEALQTLIDGDRSDQRKAIILNVGDVVNSDSFLNDDQKSLWHSCLHKLAAECVYFTALIPNRARFTNKGMIKNFPNNIGATGESVSIDLYELKHLMDRTIQNRIGVLSDQVHKYLCETSYPDYNRKLYTPVSRSGISLNMYDVDEDDDKYCCL